MVAEKLLLRPQEAADTLGISRARLYQLLADGEIGSVKLGASRRVPAVELDAFVQRLRSATEQGGLARQATGAA